MIIRKPLGKLPFLQYQRPGQLAGSLCTRGHIVHQRPGAGDVQPETLGKPQQPLQIVRLPPVIAVNIGEILTFWRCKAKYRRWFSRQRVVFLPDVRHNPAVPGSIVIYDSLGAVR